MLRVLDLTALLNELALCKYERRLNVVDAPKNQLRLRHDFTHSLEDHKRFLIIGNAPLRRVASSKQDELVPIIMDLKVLQSHR